MYGHWSSTIKFYHLIYPYPIFWVVILGQPGSFSDTLHAGQEHRLRVHGPRDGFWKLGRPSWNGYWIIPSPSNNTPLLWSQWNVETPDKKTMVSFRGCLVNGGWDRDSEDWSHIDPWMVPYVPICSNKDRQNHMNQRYFYFQGAPLCPIFVGSLVKFLFNKNIGILYLRHQNMFQF